MCVVVSCPPLGVMKAAPAEPDLSISVVVHFQGSPGTIFQPFHFSLSVCADSCLTPGVMNLEPKNPPSSVCAIVSSPVFYSYMGTQNDQ